MIQSHSKSFIDQVQTDILKIKAKSIEVLVIKGSIRRDLVVHTRESLQTKIMPKLISKVEFIVIMLQKT